VTFHKQHSRNWQPQQYTNSSLLIAS